MSSEEVISKKQKSISSRTVTAIAPVNIATIKYWGKSNEKDILPLNASISVTISTDEMRTKTSITATRLEVSYEESVTDTLLLNGSVSTISQRMKTVIQKMRDEGRKQGCMIAEWSLRIESHNNFPTAAGLASSASGMACLVFALQHLFDLKGNFSHVARLGSGSACRSMFGGFVEWTNIEDRDKSGAEVLAAVGHWPELRILICVVSDRQKSQSSTSGMQLSVQTSSLLTQRVKVILPDRLEAMRSAIHNRDFPTFAELTMKDSNQLHAICLDTFPPISYLTPASHLIIRLIHRLNDGAGETIAAYTFDAGPNSFIFVEEKNMMKVLSNLREAFPVTGESGKLEKVPVSGCDVADEQVLPEEQMVDGLKEILCVRVGEGPKLLSSMDK